MPELGKLYPLTTELFVHPSSGNVGVGTTVPGADLQVLGTVRFGGSGGGTLGAFSSVLGGQGSNLNSAFSTIAGGEFNDIDTDGNHSFIGAGFDNRIDMAGFVPPFNEASCIIVGGLSNRIEAADHAFIGGGSSNRIEGTQFAPVRFGTIAGGSAHLVQADYAAVGGGQFNQALGTWAAIPGGRFNVASGAASLAAGAQALAVHDHCFVWSDDSAAGFASTAPEQFLVRASGGVGINESSPQYALHVETQELGFVPNVGAGIDGIVVEAQDAALTLASADSGSAGSAVSLQDWSAGSLQDNWSLYRRTSSTSSALQVTYGTSANWAANAAVMTFTAAGDVGIGTAAPGAKLQVGGEVWATNFQQVSDARLKTDVREIEGALETVCGLRGVRFRWDAGHAPSPDRGDRLGFLAQEVLAVAPEVVAQGPDGLLNVSYADLVPLLVEALQEQTRRASEDRSRLERLERELSELRSRAR